MISDENDIFNDIFEDKRAFRKYIFTICVGIFVNYIFPLLIIFLLTYVGPKIYRMCIEN